MTYTHPNLVRLYRYTGSTDLKEAENGRTLDDLKFKHNETLTAFKRNMFTNIKVPLLDETNEKLSERAI